MGYLYDYDLRQYFPIFKNSIFLWRDFVGGRGTQWDRKLLFLFFLCLFFFLFNMGSLACFSTITINCLEMFGKLYLWGHNLSQKFRQFFEYVHLYLFLLFLFIFYLFFIYTPVFVTLAKWIKYIFLWFFWDLYYPEFRYLSALFFAFLT